MADFLFRLAQRAMGSAPLVQPRTDSRFAFAETGVGVAVEENDDAQVSSTAVEPRTARGEDAERRAPQPARGPQTTEPAVPVAEPPVSVSQSWATGVEPQTPDRKPRATAPVERSAPMVRRAAVAQRARAVESVKPAPAEPARRTETTVVANEEQRPTGASDNTVQAAGNRHSKGADSGKPAPPVARTRPVLRSSALFERSPGDGRRETAESRPVIHVTIGRVEVRAVQPAPSPARPSTPKPKLALEEYLRQRDEGER